MLLNNADALKLPHSAQKKVTFIYSFLVSYFPLEEATQGLSSLAFSIDQQLITMYFSLNLTGIEL